MSDTPETSDHYLLTHKGPILDAFMKLRQQANANDDLDDANYWQHEINALVDALRRLP